MPEVAGSPPAAPRLLSPEPNRIDVIPDALLLAATSFSDPDPLDEHVATEWEIWRTSGTTLVERVWSAAVTDPRKLNQVTLDDGTFEGLSQDVGLLQWVDHVARVRYRDSNEHCEVWSEWSEALPFRTDDGSSYLFDPEVIRDIYIGIPSESWSFINAEARPDGCVPHERNYYKGSLRFEGQVLEGVGVRIKGGCGSARTLSGKAAFKINLEWDDPAVPGCPAGRRIHGEKRFTLNNGVQDRSYLHEWMGYRLYRAMGVPAPRLAHVRVHVNDQLWGLYMHQESIDRRFLSRWFASNRGMLYEGTYWCNLVPENVPSSPGQSTCFSGKFDTDACNTPQPGDDPTDFSLLRELTLAIRALPPGSFYPEIEEIVDFDTFLSTWAVDSAIAHWDGSVFDIMNNYRVYHDPGTDRWTVITTGIDQTFSGDQDPWDVSGVLGRRCLEERDCEAALAARLHQVANLLEDPELLAEVEAVARRIAPDVMADPRREFSYQNHVSAVSALLSWIPSRPARLRQILAQRGY